MNRIKKLESIIVNLIELLENSETDDCSDELNNHYHTLFDEMDRKVLEEMKKEITH